MVDRAVAVNALDLDHDHDSIPADAATGIDGSADELMEAREAPVVVTVVGTTCNADTIDFGVSTLDHQKANHDGSPDCDWCVSPITTTTTAAAAGSPRKRGTDKAPDKEATDTTLARQNVAAAAAAAAAPYVRRHADDKVNTNDNDTLPPRPPSQTSSSLSNHQQQPPLNDTVDDVLAEIAGYIAPLRRDAPLITHSLPGSFAVPGINASDYNNVDWNIMVGAEPTLTTPNTTMTTNETTHDILVEATLVSSSGNDDDPETNNDNDHHHGRDMIVHAQAKPLRRFSWRSPLGVVLLSILMCFLVGVALLAYYLGVKPNINDRATTDIIKEGDNMKDNNTTRPIKSFPILQQVRERGILRCGSQRALAALFEWADRSRNTSSLLSMSNNYNDTFSNQFYPNYCQTIAAAIFGNENAAMEFVLTTDDNEYEMLGNGSIDVLVSRRDLTMSEDVYQPRATDGIAYAPPYLFLGARFIGFPEYVACADDNIKNFGNCSGIKICLPQGQSFVEELKNRIPQHQTVVVEGLTDIIQEFMVGNCNLVASSAADLGARILRVLGYTGELAVGRQMYSDARYSLVSVDRDTEWANFIAAVTWALMQAEQAGITKESAKAMGQTDIFGAEYKDMFIRAVREFGHFGELYKFPIKRTGRNALNTGSTGLLSTPMLGYVENAKNGRDPIGGGTLHSILQRGFMYCGIKPGRPGFAAYYDDRFVWEGMDIDFCTALAASLFDGDGSKVLFLEVDTDPKSNNNGFSMLHSNSIDVFAGATWTIQNSFKEPVTGTGFSFSQPYFYAPVMMTNSTINFEENLCLATRQTDPQWSAYVYWAAQSVLFAEEQGIVQQYFNKMPLVYSFGLQLERMFRDAIYAVGNYAEVYDRHVAMILPRGGRNKLTFHDRETGGPLHYLPPAI